jgi:Na+/proline symporter
MMLAGAMIWFIPPWTIRILDPDAATAYASLGKKAGDAVYFVFARDYMPVGTGGLLMAGLFAATISSMDSALNRNSGIFVRSFYAPILRKGKATDKQQLRMGRIASVVNGLLVVVCAQLYVSFKDLSLFDVVMQVATLLQSPILVPLVLAILIRKTPSWAPWATVVFGLFVSLLVVNVFTPNFVGAWFGMENLTDREVRDMTIIITIAAHLIFTAGFFCLTTLFYKEEKDPYLEQTREFFKDVDTECVEKEGQDIVDRQQRDKLGTLVMLMSAGLTLMVLIPNPLWGRLLFLGCAGTVFLIGFSLKRSAGLGRRQSSNTTAAPMP